MSCPFSKETAPPEGKLLYDEYLMLDKVLSAQKMLSGDKYGRNPACDEHLFIIIHQTYELWFKEILYELDIVREEFSKEKPILPEVIKRLNRVVMIFKLLVDQMLILETMTPMDFNDFRQFLNTASGFQSMQFRLIENKLGMRQENRVKFNQNYSKVFKNNEVALGDIEKSMTAPSVLQLLERWLETTPHLDVLWKHYKHVVETNVLREYRQENGDTCDVGEEMGGDNKNDAAIKKVCEQFETIFDGATHAALVKRGERKLSLDALHAAIVISLYKDDAMFAASHRILMLLIDIDAMLSRWRYNHVLLVQRMIGSMQVGTGGSSGYQYLRSTLSDRCKPFVDLANLTTFLVNKNDLLPLDEVIGGAAKHANATQNTCFGCKKSRKVASQRATATALAHAKRACNGRSESKDGGREHCTHCNSLTSAVTGQVCNVCVDSSLKIDVVNVIKRANGICQFRELSMNSASEDERKEMESSYESTSSTSSMN